MKRMLIDASHSEETRVVVINGNKLEDFDVEVESRKQLKGNIYLAKVMRVEPSLQAAFVNFGGNRHGFLAFNEIHTDYYQIPIADREALLADEQVSRFHENEEEKLTEENSLETLGGDVSEELESRRPPRQLKNYKIQEVIKRNQVLLVQVVKEERGSKGAALSTYLSLAGRYCVLMPNTARGGGISRKINNTADRKRLKTVVNDLGIPPSMAVIIRTAGSKRSKVEIKRDYEYTTRLWARVRELTLESIAPCLVHEEGNLIKRSIRDLYSKELEEVIVAGDGGYRIAKDFMKLLIPSHTKRVQLFSDPTVSLMQKYKVEAQLDAIHSPEVSLKSGGYMVISPTEALVSIDVNSGKATKERNIEETALRTNLEAALEISSQLKLRDLAGLIVIDFIDMELARNQSKVERQIKDAMRNDRARIQIGKISPFGLLELSRQRLRPSLIETSSETCPHCKGSGTIRSTNSTALHMLRVIEEQCSQDNSASHNIFVPTSVALYLFNHKRDVLNEIETRYKTAVFLNNDDTLIPPDYRIKQVNQPQDSKSDQDTNAKNNREAETGKKRRRRHSKKPNPENSSQTKNIKPKSVGPGTEESKTKTGSNKNEDGTQQVQRRRRGNRNNQQNVQRTDNNQILKSELNLESIIQPQPDISTQSNSTPELKQTDTSKPSGAINLADNVNIQDEKAPPRRRRKKATPPPGSNPVSKEQPENLKIRKQQKSNNSPAVKSSGAKQSLTPEKTKPGVKKEKISKNKIQKITDIISKPLTEESSSKTTVVNVETNNKNAISSKNGWWRR